MQWPIRGSSRRIWSPARMYTADARIGISSRFADPLDSACEGMVAGFSLGSLICGLHRARSQRCFEWVKLTCAVDLQSGEMVPSRGSAPSPRNAGYGRAANDMPAPHRHSPPGILRREHFGSKGGDRCAYSLRRISPPFEPVDDKIHKTGKCAEPRSSGNSLTDARKSLSKISAFLYNEQTDRGNEVGARENETTQASDEHGPTRVRRQRTTDNLQLTARATKVLRGEGQRSGAVA